MDNYYKKNESNKNNTENSNQDNKNLEEREGKGKKDNVYVHIMTGQKKSAGIDHFEVCRHWDITKFVSEAIKEKHNALQKRIAPNTK